MAITDFMARWNIIQELRARLNEYLAPNIADVVNSRLIQITSDPNSEMDLRRKVLQAQEIIEEYPNLLNEYRKMAFPDGSDLSVRLTSVPGPGTPIQPGPRYCCEQNGCGESLYQLFDGQIMKCPKDGSKMSLCTCQLGEEP